MSRARRRGSPPPRDHSPSAFAPILSRLVRSTAGAIAAALVDSEGETVDYAGRLDVFDIKVAAAHWQIAASQIGATKLPPARQIVVRARTKGYVVRMLEVGYVLVVVTHRHAAFGASERAFQEAEARVRAEAGWPAPPRSARWFGVEVELEQGQRMRPARVLGAAGWMDVEVIGTVVGLPPKERGFRARLESGAELILVRERDGRWFADEHLFG